jgi:hypothetical protein
MAKQGLELAAARDQTPPALRVAFDSRGRRLVSGREDGTIKHWRLTDQSELRWGQGEPDLYFLVTGQKGV